MWKKNNSCPNAVSDCSVGRISGKRFGNGKCWTAYNYMSSVYWADSLCSGSGGSMPTQQDFQNLISDDQAGSGACLYEQGWSGGYWSSTNNGKNYIYYVLLVSSSSAYISNYRTEFQYGVRCVSS